jgi:hypothetical protein
MKQAKKQQQKEQVQTIQDEETQIGDGEDMEME